MKRTNRHGKETAKSAKQPTSNLPTLTVQQMQKWFVVPECIPPAIQAGIRALAGRVHLARPSGRPRVNSARDAQIVRMRDAQRYTFGKIALKLNMRREVAYSAYRRMKREPRQGLTKFR